MSAYGAQKVGDRPDPLLPAVHFPLRRAHGAYNSIAFLHLQGPKVPPRWTSHMSSIFAQEVEEGKTYPQNSPFGEEDFRSYFLAYDIVVGIFDERKTLAQAAPSVAARDVADLGPLDQIEVDRIACFYYIKPNYPGRSSHLCNAGFVVPPAGRSLGIGSLAGKSFLFFGPSLGYRGSVFNLVYETNEASVKIWDRLGFTRIGKIPGAGYLRREGGREEYVDAWVIHGNFAEIGVEERALQRV